MSRLNRKNVVDVAPLCESDRRKYSTDVTHSSQEDINDISNIPITATTATTTITTTTTATQGHGNQSDSHKSSNQDNQEPNSDWTNSVPTDQSAATSPSSAESTSVKSNDPSKVKSQTQDESHTTPKNSGKAGSNGHLTDASKSSESTSASVNIVMKSGKGADKKKKGSAWYNVLSPTYKSRSEDFRRLFKDIPNEERLLIDYSCALQKDILVHGRLYITQNWICFYANIFRWETVLTIRCKDISSITKERTARVIPNAIQILTKDEKYFFTSFSARDKTFMMLFRVWQFALLNQPMVPQEMWQFVHNSYGEELGLTSSDDDYVSPIPEDDMGGLEALDDENIPQQDDKEPPDDSDNNVNGDTTHLSVPSMTPSDSFSMSPSSENIQNQRHIQRMSAPPTTLHVPTPSPQGTSGDYPTDMGDTSEDDEEEVLCVGHDHSGIVHLNDVVYMPVDKLFEQLFTDSKFYRDFLAFRKTYDLVLCPWPDETDSDGNKVRTITYTISLNYSVGPKSSPTTEKQTCLSCSKPGRIYVIDAEVINGGIPYGENFMVVNRYCLTRVSSNKSHLRVTSHVRYRKSVWGLVKNFIEKNANSGLAENYRQLGDHLRALTQDQVTAAPGSQPGRKRVLKRRHHNRGDKSPGLKRAGEANPLTVPQSATMNGGPARDEWNLKFGAEPLVRIVCLILLLLVMFNALLFYKLLSLETKANVLHSTTPDFNDLKNTPRSQEEWTRLLQQQQGLHEAEMERWQQILSSSIKLMEQMKVTLTHLHDSINTRATFAETMKQEQV